MFGDGDGSEAGASLEGELISVSSCNPVKNVCKDLLFELLEEGPSRELAYS